MTYALLLPSWVEAGLKIRRRARLRRFLNALDLPALPNIIDVGCGINDRSFSDFVPRQWRITGVDMHAPGIVNHGHPHFRYVQGDACNLHQFADKQFDLTVSFGMLEHILGDAYHKAAAEMQRVSKSWLVVVPWRWAPLEPHYAFPLFGAMPNGMQEWLIRHVLHRDRAQDFVEYHRANFDWRSIAQYKREFPGSRIVMAQTLDTMAIVGGEYLKR
jgi:ubiquinone/menaquinone biosynthesis C-methylase UbiE